MQRKKKCLVLKSIKYRDHVPCSYGYKLISVDEPYSKPYNFYFVCKFSFDMIEESKYCDKLLKKTFNKRRVLTKIKYEDFKISYKCWIFKRPYKNNDIKVKI